MNDEYFMKSAIQEAEKAAREGNWPMGCVIVVNDKIISRAHNTGYTENVRLAHAELKALLLAKDELEKHRGEATVYTTYEPCPMCFGAIVLNKIKRVVTGINMDESGCLSLQDHLPAFWAQPKFHFEITRGVLAKECLAVYLKGQMIEKHKESGFVKGNL